MKKTLALVLAVLMVLTLAACAKTPASSTAPASSAAPAESKPESKEETKIEYPLKDGGELSLAWAELAAVTAGGTKWEETPFIKGLQENTGVKLTIFHPQDWSVYDAGREYHDIIARNFGSNAQKAISDNIIIPIEDYLAQYAPDYKAFVESNDDWNKMITTAGGHKYGFNFIRMDEVLCVSSGLIIREDWLKDLGLDVPETAEELKNVLIAFRDKKGATAPMSITYSTMSWGLGRDAMIAGAFGLPSTQTYVDNGVVKYGAYEDNYKDYLAYMNDLYKEGLLDKNFMTIDSKMETANLLNGVSGFVLGGGGAGMGNWMTNAENAGNKDFSITGVKPLVAKKGDRPISGNYEFAASNGNAAAISSQCKNIELACQFLNYGYTEAGHNYWNFGTEGVSWNKVSDNKYYTHEYTDKVMKAEGLTVQQGLAQYCMAWNNGPFGQDPDYIWQFYGRQQQKDALERWSQTDAAKYELPSLSIPEDSLDEYRSISGNITTYISENTAKFFTGEKSLDEFADYQAELKKMGIEDYIKITQDAYDEYQSRK